MSFFKRLFTSSEGGSSHSLNTMKNKCPPLCTDSKCPYHLSASTSLILPPSPIHHNTFPQRSHTVVHLDSLIQKNKFCSRSVRVLKKKSSQFFKDLAPSLGLSKAAIVHSTYVKDEKLTSIREVRVSSRKHLSKVLPGLYIGSKEAAHNVKVLQQHNITHIVNVASEVEVRHEDKLLKVLKIEAKDLPSYNLSEHFIEVCVFIYQAIHGKLPHNLSRTFQKLSNIKEFPQKISSPKRKFSDAGTASKTRGQKNIKFHETCSIMHSKEMTCEASSPLLSKPPPSPKKSPSKSLKYAFQLNNTTNSTKMKQNSATNPTRDIKNKILQESVTTKTTEDVSANQQTLNETTQNNTIFKSSTYTASSSLSSTSSTNTASSSLSSISSTNTASTISGLSSTTAPIKTAEQKFSIDSQDPSMNMQSQKASSNCLLDKCSALSTPTKKQNKKSSPNKTASPNNKPPTPINSPTTNNKQTTKHSVLVHCYFGVSRSATVVLAYLVAAENMSLADAMAYIKVVRPQAKPNEGFLRQLKEFEERICNL